MNNLSICHTCKHRAKNCGGDCLCLFERKNPVDILARAASGCPAGYFKNPPKTYTFAPGNIVTSILESIGYKKTDGCGCRAFATKMNAWGWRGCIRHRVEIIAWLTAKAKEQNIEVDGDRLRHLIRAGLADQWRRWRSYR